MIVRESRIFGSDKAGDGKAAENRRAHRLAGRADSGGVYGHHHHRQPARADRRGGGGHCGKGDQLSCSWCRPPCCPPCRHWAPRISAPASRNGPSSTLWYASLLSPQASALAVRVLIVQCDRRAGRRPLYCRTKRRSSAGAAVSAGLYLGLHFRRDPFQLQRLFLRRAGDPGFPSCTTSSAIVAGPRFRAQWLTSRMFPDTLLPMGLATACGLRCCPVLICVNCLYRAAPKRNALKRLEDSMHVDQLFSHRRGGEALSYERQHACAIMRITRAC